MGSLPLDSAGTREGGATRKGWQSRPRCLFWDTAQGCSCLSWNKYLQNPRKYCEWRDGQALRHTDPLGLYVKHIWMFFNPMKKYAFPTVLHKIPNVWGLYFVNVPEDIGIGKYFSIIRENNRWLSRWIPRQWIHSLESRDAWEWWKLCWAEEHSLWLRQALLTSAESTVFFA